MGQAIPAEQMHDTDHVARVFARLRLALGRDIALRVACQDGTPVRAEHDLKKCQWCGKRWDDHPVQSIAAEYVAE
jgi:tRNA U54 and U55 pseudouridine synthase Pus10